MIRSGVARVVQSVALGERELRTIHPPIDQRSASVHLKICDVSIPIWDAAPSGISVKVLSRQTIRRWNEGGGGAPIWLETFAVNVQLGVVFARPPSSENPAQARYIFVHRVSHWLQLGRKVCDGADIKVTIRPAIGRRPIPRASELSTVEWQIAH